MYKTALQNGVTDNSLLIVTESAICLFFGNCKIVITFVYIISVLEPVGYPVFLTENPKEFFQEIRNFIIAM